MADSLMRQHAATTIVLVIALLGVPASGYDFAGGTGQPHDPYQIATAEQLGSIGSDPNLLDKHFALVADIDLDPALPGGRVFDAAVIAPDLTNDAHAAGWSGLPFDGCFDGRGHRIYNLSINHTMGYGVGLFGFIEVGGRVHHLRVEGDYSIGRRASSEVGGLAGTNRGVIWQCTFTGSVEAGTAVGGLVGFNRGVVAACTSSGTVAGDEQVGGLVGLNQVGLVLDAYANASVVGTDDVGGLVGRASTSTISSSYFLDTGAAVDNGLGQALSDAQMRERESFTGWDFHGVETDGNREIWSMPADGYPVLAWQSDVTGLVWLPDARGAARETVEVQVADAGLTLSWISYDYSEEIPADGVVALVPAHPVAPGAVVDIVISKGPCNWAQDEGDGTRDNPYHISTAGQLEAMNRYPFDHFVLDSDINLTGRIYANALICAYDYTGPAFGGSLDGQGHTIAGLTIISTGEYVGLFGNISRTGEVQNLVLTDAWTAGIVRSQPYPPIQGGRCGVGALAGECSGTITRCCADGRAAGTYEVGGLVGKLAQSSASMAECSASTAVSGYAYVGPLVGVNEGTINNSYANGTARGNDHVGGLAGYSKGSISTCYAGTVSWSLQDGFICGLMGLGSPNSNACHDNYYLSDADYPSNAPCAATGLSDTELKKRESFTGWDFFGSYADGADDLWFMPKDGYPVLTWQMARSGLQQIPDISGVRPEQGQALLRAAGFIPGVIRKDYDPVVIAGMVITTVPQGYVPVGSEVDILASLGPYDWRDNPGTGSAAEPYEISTVGQLLFVGPQLSMRPPNWEYYGGTFYTLTADLDMAGRVFTAAPIHSFMDILDGGGHTISNLAIATDGNDVGLFGRVADRAVVANLNLQNVTVTAENAEGVGGLAGRNEGFIRNCHVSGSTNGSVAVGGLVGENTGVITTCHSDGTVTGQPGVRTVRGYWGQVLTETITPENVGGLVGLCREGFVSACYSSADVAVAGEPENVGGLIGQLGHREATSPGSYYAARVIGTGILLDSYATGAVSASVTPSPGGWNTPKPSIGSLVGSVTAGDVADCYSLAAPLLGGQDPIAISCYYVGTEEPDYPSPWAEPVPWAVALTDEQMKSQESFVGWDFEHTWTLCEGLDYPRLWWEDRTCPEPEPEPEPKPGPGGR